MKDVAHKPYGSNLPARSLALIPFGNTLWSRRFVFAAAFIVAVVLSSSTSASAQFRNNAFEIQAGYSGYGTTTDWLNTLVLGPTNEWGMSDQPMLSFSYVRLGDLPFTSWDDLWAYYPVATMSAGIASPDGNTVQTGIQFAFTVGTGVGLKYYLFDEKYRPYVRAEVVAFTILPVTGTKIVEISPGAGVGGYGGSRVAIGYEMFVAPEISIAVETSLLGLFTIFAPPKLAHSTRLGVNIYF